MPNAPTTPIVPPKTSLFDIVWHKWWHRPYRLHTIDHGGDGPIIILLHGLGSSSANWDPLIPLLKDTYRCISIDLIGFGQSPKPQWFSYTMDDHIRSIHSTIRGMHLRRPFSLVGHSLGSLLAIRYAQQHQKYLDRVILLSPPVYAPLNQIKNYPARQRTSMYLKAYKYIRTSKRVTPATMLRLSRIVPPLRSMFDEPTSWLPFIHTLEKCVEQQTIIQDIIEVKAPIDIFYGLFDEVVVPYNVRQLASIRDVTLYPLKVNHTLTKRYAAAVAKVLKNTTSSPIQK